MGLQCPGREKLGDGTVAACALHTADNYQRLAGFLQAAGRIGGAHAEAGQGRRIPGFLLARGHSPRAHAERGDGDGGHDADYRAETIDLEGLLRRLSAGRSALSVLADLTDQQLDAVPAAGGMKFCDGQRTLEQVVTNVFKHQSHSVDALKAALSSEPAGSWE